MFRRTNNIHPWWTRYAVDFAPHCHRITELEGTSSAILGPAAEMIRILVLHVVEMEEEVRNHLARVAVAVLKHILENSRAEDGLSASRNTM